jgi:hypothetical protein
MRHGQMTKVRNALASRNGGRKIRVAFAGGNGFPPEDTGGVQSSTVDLALRLRDPGTGRRCSRRSMARAFGLRARMNVSNWSRAPFVRDRLLRFADLPRLAPETAVPAFAKRARPDVAVVQCHDSVPIARAFARRACPWSSTSATWR